MPKLVRLLLAAIAFFALPSLFAQVTLITPKGSQINSGFVLPNGHPILTSSQKDGMYTTDGTSITLITNLANHLIPGFIYKGNGYFEGDSGKLYVTDGTAAGTHAVAQINKTGSSAYPNTVFEFNSLAYFIANDGVHGTELWSTNGTTANTKLVADINGDTSGSVRNPLPYYPFTATQFFINGSYVLFTAYGADSTFGLYKLTASGVITILKNDFADSTTITYDTTSGKTFFIAAAGTGATAANQLWATDGTSTRLLYNAGAGSTIYNPRLVNGNIIFEVKNNITYASAIWATDGTAANTSLLKNINARIDNYGEVVNNKLVFTVRTDSSAYELWSTDGTTSNTQLLLNIKATINEAHSVNNKLLFRTYSSSAGSELWSTDGTVANTKSIKHISIGVDPGLVINNKLIFEGYTSTTGNELWSTDGTVANTILLKDINPGTTGSNPGFVYDENYNYTPFKGKYYFTADDGGGSELWCTDGTPGGTTLTKDINPGDDGVQNNGSFFYTTTGIYFTEDNGYLSELGLWVTDGTTEGTTEIQGYNPGEEDDDPNYKTTYLFIYNNQLYLTQHFYDGGSKPNLYKINTTVSILPVGLSNFTASLQPSSVLLNWQTASEINTDYFGVERSADGVIFNNIGNVAASGNSSTKHDYTLNDYSALHLGSSTLYYRLKTIDKDGKYTYSSIIKLQLHGGEFAYSLSPNPVHSQLTISFTTDNATKQASLKITDANGKPVYEKSLQGLQPGSVQRYINVAGFESGIYYVQLITDSGTKTLKFVKQ